jgi:beta-lactam-binding protein with PASTA domain
MAVLYFLLLGEAMVDKERDTKVGWRFRFLLPPLVNKLINIVKWGAILLFAVIVGMVSAWFSLKINMSGREVKVPEVIGMKPDDAIKILSKSSLRLSIEEGRRFSSTMGKGMILLQNPAPGEIVKRGNLVRVVLSSGSERKIIPRLIGSSARSAQIIIQNEGLRVGRFSFVYYHLPRDTVIAQEPLPSMEEFPGARVDLLISLGPRQREFVMPNLVGTEIAVTRAFLLRNGFRIANIRGKYYPGVPPDVVIQQYPQAGYKIEENEVINLWISER